MRVVKSAYYGNWTDNIGYKISYFLLPFAVKIPFLTPNIVTISSFFTYAIGSLMLILPYPLKALGGILIFAGYIGDDLDGQLARETGKGSELGNYLDKVLDVIKIFIISSSLSYAVYLQTHNLLHIFLGFIACAFFYMRYYIKLETVLRQEELDSAYLDKSSEKMKEVEENMLKRHKELSKTLAGKIQAFLDTNRTIIFIDEAEFASFTAFFAVINKLEIALWVIAIAQVIIFCARFWERGYQLVHKSERLYYFMRK